MNTIQLGVRIPSSLNQRLMLYMAKTGMSKTEIVLNALAVYMGCTQEIPLAERMDRLEANMAVLEALVKNS